ncbi:TolC family protein [Rubripirellula amarantea]|uniref:TolC family protein n=1 Tax=Rubripirellula amarantea TaxID=2527999 RepID=UPI001F5EC85A|nr:TolC family protein [Rubripirellula amarantea]
MKLLLSLDQLRKFAITLVASVAVAQTPVMLFAQQPVVRETSPVILAQDGHAPFHTRGAVVQPAAEMSLHSPGMIEDATMNAWPQSEPKPLRSAVSQPDRSHLDVPQSTTHFHTPPFHVPAPVSHGPHHAQLDPYRIRAEEIQPATNSFAQQTQLISNMPFGSWWESEITGPLGFASEALPVDVAGLTQTALVQSPLIQGVLAEPNIRQQDLVIEHAAFDSLAFIEGKFADTNDPVGSALTTGDNSARFRDETFTSGAGLRKKALSGGALELVQRGGFQDNNSTFLIPNPQGTTRLEVNFTQPLMRDRGRAVNQTRIVLAQLDVKLATNEARGELETHLIDVTRAYWGLYQARAEWLQRKRLYDRATELRSVLRARSGVDSQQRQILRAEAAVASRQSELVRIETRIRNLQARLRTLTGDPNLTHGSNWELIPQDIPMIEAISLSPRDATITALDNRTDVTEAIRKIQAISVRVGAAKNQVLPRLDLILHSHLAGLDSQRDTFGAFTRQFSDGRPSYAAGLLYEMPIGNRAAQARLNRNRWEMCRALNEFQQTTEEAFTDVEIAVRETQTAYAEMVAKNLATDAAAREVAYLEQRWQLLPDPNESAVLLIEDLIDAQQRLADEERALVAAQVGYAISWVQVRKSMGVLLRLDDPNSVPILDISPPSWSVSP